MSSSTRQPEEVDACDAPSVAATAASEAAPSVSPTLSTASTAAAEGHAPSNAQRGPRDVCSSCSRPASVCLCSLFPKEPLPCPCEVVLFQHPKERKQKNRSGWIAERCISRVSTAIGRRLAERDAAPAVLHRLWDEPEACAIVFPSKDSKPLEEIAKSLKLLVFLDATWRFAQEMLKSSPALANVAKVELRPPPGASPQFLVRKPVKLGSSNPTDSGKQSKGEGSSDGEHDGARTAADCPARLEDDRWGFCTAEAVALAIDAMTAAKLTEGEHTTPETIGPAWEAVGVVVQGHVESQLSRTRNVRHRPERPGYLPGLYEQCAGFDAR